MLPYDNMRLFDAEFFTRADSRTVEVVDFLQLLHGCVVSSRDFAERVALTDIHFIGF